jgi:hypothetical protein
MMREEVVGDYPGMVFSGTGDWLLGRTGIDGDRFKFRTVEQRPALLSADLRFWVDEHGAVRTNNEPSYGHVEYQRHEYWVAGRILTCWVRVD